MQLQPLHHFFHNISNRGLLLIQEPRRSQSPLGIQQAPPSAPLAPSAAALPVQAAGLASVPHLLVPRQRLSFFLHNTTSLSAASLSSSAIRSFSSCCSSRIHSGNRCSTFYDWTEHHERFVPAAPPSAAAPSASRTAAYPYPATLSLSSDSWYEPPSPARPLPPVEIPSPSPALPAPAHEQQTHG